MSKHPNLKSIELLLAENSDFSLTSTQYENETGAPLPKENYYLKHKSAVAKLAKQSGFRIIIQERTIDFKKERQGK